MLRFPILHRHPIVTGVAVRLRAERSVPFAFLEAHLVFTSPGWQRVWVCVRRIRPDTTDYCRLQRKYGLNVHTRAPFCHCHMGGGAPEALRSCFCYAMGRLLGVVPKKIRSSPRWPTEPHFATPRVGKCNVLERRAKPKKAKEKRKQWRLSDHHHGTMPADTFSFGFKLTRNGLPHHSSWLLVIWHETGISFKLVCWFESLPQKLIIITSTRILKIV